MSQGPGLRWALLGPFLNLHASGGPEGITHTLEHLGEPIREWSSDLGEYPTADDYIGAIAASVDEELAGVNFVDVLAARDRALLALLESKRDVGLGS
jgi:carnitine 3-dehydrogenase